MVNDCQSSIWIPPKTSHLLLISVFLVSLCTPFMLFLHVTYVTKPVVTAKWNIPLSLAHVHTQTKQTGDVLTITSFSQTQDIFQEGNMKSLARQTDTDNTKALQDLLRHMVTEHKPPDNVFFGYNVSHYDLVPLDKEIPDIRCDRCKNVSYNMADMPSVTVISVFHNEALTMLLRHVHVMLKHSPPSVLKEIILVDDFSTGTYLGAHLEEYFTLLDLRIKIIRNKIRQGLVRSRLAGANAAKGEIIVFLDAHMRCSPGWLEPLVTRLKQEPKLVLQPLVPSVDRLEAGVGDRVLMRPGFAWDLTFAWYFIPPYISQLRMHENEPYPSPALVGCAIAVNKRNFFSMGGFDPNLEVWGGEHMELAFRTWMCGGRIETIPCSVVGHLYRPVPYLFGGPALEIITKNMLRVADVWMDGYAEIVRRTLCGSLGYLPHFSHQELKTIEERRGLRRRLRCKTFSWYLKHVFPEVEVPTKDAVYFGEFMNMNTSACLTVENGTLAPTRRKCSTSRIVPEDHFTIDKSGRFRHKGKCIIAHPTKKSFLIDEEYCGKNSGISWTLRNGKGPIVYRDSHNTLCLTHVLDLPDRGYILLDKCDTASVNQIWTSWYFYGE